MPASLLFSSTFDDPQPWRRVIADSFPHLDFQIWPDSGPLDHIRYAVIWTIDHGALQRMPNLKGILALGAGVDQILADPQFPTGVPLARLNDAGMAEQMVEYCLYGVLHHHRQMARYHRFQARKDWTRLPSVAAHDRVVGVLGLGQLGGQVAQAVAALGFTVFGWSRTEKIPTQHPNVHCTHGADGLAMVQSQADIIINMLPLTPATRGLLNAEFFAKMRDGSYLINVARGAHVVEADLCDALERGKLSGALLDVFQPEPLAHDNPLWRHPNATITPHIAAQTLDKPAMDQILDNLRRLENGAPMIGVVAPETGY